MKKVIYYAASILLLAHCASKEVSTADAKKALDEKYTPKVGTATKSELIEQFGNAEWCKVETSGDETCRFYLKKGTKWVGDKRDKKSFTQFDEVIADFDSNGVLRSFKSNAQR